MGTGHSAAGKCFAVLAAAMLVVAVALWGALPAWAATSGAGRDAGETAQKSKSITVALTVADTSDAWATTVLANGAYTFSSSENATVADLLEAAGFTEGTQQASQYENTVYFSSWGYPNFLGKTDNGLDYTDEAYAWWNCFLDGNADDYTAYGLTSPLVDGGHYQYIFCKSGAWTGYTESIVDPLEKGSSAKPVKPAKSSVNLYRAARGAQLKANLQARFADGGADAAMGSNTFAAAVALNAVSRGSEVLAENIAANLAADEQGGALDAGTLAKYILALTAAGIDCTDVEIGGAARNLVKEMSAACKDYSNYWGMPAILEAAAQERYQSATLTARAESLAAKLLGALKGDGLLDGGFGPDVQLTAQAAVALSSYREVEGVEEFLDGVASTLAGKMQGDGGFCQSVDTTADVVIALASLGVDVEGEQFVASNGSTPLGYLLACSNETLDAITGTYDETMSAATVLLALTANDESDKVYQLKDVEGPVDPEPEPEPAPDPAPGADPVDPAEPDEDAVEVLPATGDDATGLVGAACAGGFAAVGGLAVALFAVMLIARRKKENR